MAGNAYLDFDLRFTKEDAGYRAEVVQSPGGGGGRQAFHLPFEKHELENYLLKIGQRRVGMRKVDSPESHAARDFGSKLFEAVFRDELQTVFRRSLEAARSNKRGLRIRLHLGETPELADLPWEYLYERPRREFFALSTETPVVRYFDLSEPIKPLAVTPPLRVLVMLSNPSDVAPLDVEAEWRNLKAAVKHLEERNLLILERLDRATLGALQSHLRKFEYHVFHFVGHGTFDSESQESVLAFEDEHGRARLVSGDDLGIHLRDEDTLRLVLLNACEGARASRTDPFSGAAQGLVLRNIPAVIAMQFEVSDEAAIALAGGFYEALADDYPVDAALTEARKAVHAAGCTVEWGTPVLYLSAPDGRIFDIEKKLGNEGSKETKRGIEPPVIPPPPNDDSLAREREKQPPIVEDKHRSRPWIWLVAGVVVTLAGIICLGLWISSRVRQPYIPPGFATPTPWVGPTSTPWVGVPPTVQLGVPTYAHQVPLTTPKGPTPGLGITVPVSVAGGANRRVQVVAKFNYANGGPLFANQQETTYRDTGGLVATGNERRLITSDNEAFADQSMTIPYYAFNLPPTNWSTTYNLSLVVYVYIDDTLITQSAPVFFSFNW